jgi:hypothetical protein
MQIGITSNKIGAFDKIGIYTAFHIELPFLLIIQRVQNANINRATQWIINKKRNI